MPATSKQPAEKGSQKWLQVLINHHPDLITKALRNEPNWPAGLSINWLSPLASKDYAEYHDKKFVKILDVELKCRSLRSFWPNRGAHWDGLGKSSAGNLVLIEAKARITEISKAGTKAKNANSICLIQRSLDETRTFLCPSSKADWSKTYYQYTNRLAHLYLLRELNKLPAYLVNVYFINDTGVGSPASEKAWEDKLESIKQELGIKSAWLDKYCIDLFFDVKDLK